MFTKVRIRYIAITLSAILVAALTLSLIDNAVDMKGKQGVEIGSFPGSSLLPPPAYAVSGPTPPLNTTAIGFIAYYQRSAGFTLSNTLPAFLSYTDGGNYYDGKVRVWDSGTIGGSSTTTSDTYVDISVRVRTDGWVIAWFDRQRDDAAAIVWWGHTRQWEGNPPLYSTTLSRAIEIVFQVAGVGFPGYNAIGIFDYSQPTATRLLIFGMSKGLSAAIGTINYYYTIPTSSSLVPIRLLIRTGGETTFAAIAIDGGQIYSRTNSGAWGWSTYELNATQYMTKGVQHTITQSYNFVNSVAFVMWTG